MPAQARDRATFGLERLVFFSDAVFAIAITLLVIDLRLPDLGEHVSDQQLSAALGALWPRVFAYGLSFWVIGLYWLAHWRRYQYIERVDEALIALNLLLLGLVAFMPFPTALMGQFGDRPGIIVLYVVTLSAAGILGPLTWLYARRRGFVARDLPPGYVRLTVVRAFSVPAIMLGSLLFLPLVGPLWVEASWFLIVPLQFIIARRYGSG